MKLLKQDPAGRLSKLQTQLVEARTKLTDNRAAIGVAVADDDENAVAKMRCKIAKLETRISELEAAIPVAEQRVKDHEAALERLRQAAEAKRRNELRLKRIKAATQVDAAMKMMAEEFQKYAALEVPSRLVGRRMPQGLRSAAYQHMPRLAAKLGIPLALASHRRSLQAFEEVANTIYPEEIEDEQAATA